MNLYVISSNPKSLYVLNPLCLFCLNNMSLCPPKYVFMSKIFYVFLSGKYVFLSTNLYVFMSKSALYVSKIPSFYQNFIFFFAE